MTGGDFWSRRKAAAAAEARAEAKAAEQSQIALTEAELAAKPDDELLAEAGLPEPEAAQSAEDVRAYLQAALPKRLKDRALRRLWRINPILANLDGLVDYGEDYTDAATVVENLQTVYQVGRGMISRFEDLDVAEDPSPDDAATAATDDPQDDPVAGDADGANEQNDPELTPDPAAIVSLDRDQQPPRADPENIFDDKLSESAIVTTAYRRMRFRFKG